jgi:hypothetical protein
MNDAQWRSHGIRYCDRKFHFTVYGAHLGDDKGGITGSIVIYNGDVNYA